MIGFINTIYCVLDKFAAGLIEVLSNDFGKWLS